jgi:transcriptional regulator GlxA family with amidase domain
LIEEDYGRYVALATAQEIVTPPINRNGQQGVPKPIVFNSQPADRFAELVAWILRHLHEDLSVNALARRACMSPSHFNRAFKSVFGSTPAEFVENLRLNEAFRRAFERRFAAKPRSYVATSDWPSTAILAK